MLEMRQLGRCLTMAIVALVCACSETAELPPGVGGSTTASGGAGGQGASTTSSTSSSTTGSGGEAAAGGDAGGGTGGAGGQGGAVDDDGDGIEDALELTVAEDYFPFYSIAPNDDCPLHGVLFRLTPHPANSTLIMIWYDVLFERDCGAGGHLGDDETFGAIVDPALPAPDGLLALRAISHQDTLCEHVNECGTLPGCDPCTTADRNGEPYPVVFASWNKHGGYTDETACDLSVVCDFGGCTLSSQADAPPFVNAGEPTAPLTNDLTADGFITPAHGWTEPGLMGFDPWGPDDFGNAGNIADDLQDPAFIIDPNGC